MTILSSTDSAPFLDRNWQNTLRQSIARVYSKGYGLVPSPEAIHYLSEIFVKAEIDLDDVEESVRNILDALLRQDRE